MTVPKSVPRGRRDGPGSVSDSDSLAVSVPISSCWANRTLQNSISDTLNNRRAVVPSGMHGNIENVILLLDLHEVDIVEL